MLFGMLHTYKNSAQEVMCIKLNGDTTNHVVHYSTSSQRAPDTDWFDKVARRAPTNATSKAILAVVCTDTTRC